MKHLLLSIALLFCVATISQAQDRWLYWKYKDYHKGINFTVPRFVIGTGSLFFKTSEERKLMRRLHKVRLLVFEEGSPISERDVRRFNRKARRNHLEEIITVREGKTRVQIMAKERRGALRKAVVFVNSPEDGFFMISLKGKLRMKDINDVIKRIRERDEEDGDDDMPNIPKIPELLRA
jgi:hypothetical protein